MTTKELKINYFEYSSLNEMQEEDKILAETAIKTMSTAYAPYSNFHVGAAVRLEDGTIVKGSNQENAAYPSGTCAERAAMFAAGANHPDKAILALAIAGGANGELCDTPVMPCGACRQVMAEYQRKGNGSMNLIMVGKNKIYKFKKVNDILPFIFDNL